MPKIYFEDGVINGEYVYDGCLYAKLKNKKSCKYLKKWAKRKDSRKMVLIWLNKIWLMLDCRPFHHQVEKFKEGKTLSFTFVDDRGVVLTKGSEYLETDWIREARKELRKTLKKMREAAKATRRKKMKRKD